MISEESQTDLKSSAEIRVSGSEISVSGSSNASGTGSANGGTSGQQPKRQEKPPYSYIALIVMAIQVCEIL